MGEVHQMKAFYNAVSRTGADSPNPWIRKSAEIGGWLFAGEPEFLWELATRPADGDILEVGSWMGKSACILAGACQTYAPDTRVVCVDTFHMDGTPDQEAYHRRLIDGTGTFYQFVANATRLGFENTVVPIAAFSTFAVPILRGPFRMAFVDGSHDRAGCSRDVTLCFPLLSQGGVLALHDTAGGSWPEVEAFVREELETCPVLRRIGQRGTITAYEKLL